jgi:putative Mg2+ transporter-C (MgtC) family protein
VKPLERRFISAKQRRQLMLVVDRGSLTFHSLHDALGTSSPRVKQFVVQQADDRGNIDEVMITLSRVSQPEYDAICSTLRGLPGVKEFREEGTQS